MQTITPELAAQLADNVYRITNDFEAEGFLQRKEFSNEVSDKAALTADVGSRLIQVSDGFGICARGAGDYKNDAFIIFRGTTSRNYGADWLTDAYCGVNINDALLLIQKIMRALGMKIAETAQELTQQMIKLVLTRLLSKLYNEARRALKDLAD